MHSAQLARFRAYLDALAPHVTSLRENGWPVEITVEAKDGHVHVTAQLDVDDTRTPIESQISAEKREQLLREWESPNQ
jgi:hypothetical protein